MLRESDKKIIRHQFRNSTHEQRSKWAYEVLEEAFKLQKMGNTKGVEKIVLVAAFVEEL